MNITRVSSWGYPIGNTSRYDGVVGLLQQGEIQIAIVGLLFRTARLDIIDYAGETERYE
jgi:hypothetical protein